jgi:hypothetical protein
MVRAFMLSLSFHRQQLRRTARAMLLAWLMATLAGIANACLMQPRSMYVPAAQAGAAAAATPDAAAAQASHETHDGATEPGAGSAHAGKAGCLKFCADESSTLTKSDTLQPDTAAAVVETGFAPLSDLDIATIALRRGVDPLRAGGPPLVIRFRRLTL